MSSYSVLIRKSRPMRIIDPLQFPPENLPFGGI